jgi:hypothetical protein
MRTREKVIVESSRSNTTVKAEIISEDKEFAKELKKKIEDLIIDLLSK